MAPRREAGGLKGFPVSGSAAYGGDHPSRSWSQTEDRFRHAGPQLRNDHHSLSGTERRKRATDDGEKALNLFLDPEQHSDRRPDILIIDLNLPKRSGLEVLQQLRKDKRYEDLRVVIFTSSDSPRDRESVAALGITHYFRKPAQYEKFLEIGEILKDILAKLRSDA
jgi:CheY-like chemotaxis protein